MRHTLIVLGSAGVAVWLGVHLANERYFWPSLALFVTLTAVLVRLLRLPLDLIAVGLVVFGYLVGNRGFAQLMPSPQVPLLPAEAALLVAGGWAFAACAFERRVPWRADALHWCVLAWFVIGLARFPFDVRTHGFLAVRDFATIYYTLFFFITRRLAERPDGRRYLIGCVLAGVVILPPLYALFELIPDFFYNHLQVRGVPLLLYKSDLVFTFTAGGLVLLFHWAQGRVRYWMWLYCTVLFLAVMSSNSRASIVGLLAVVLLHALTRRWSLPILHGASGAVAALVLLAAATFTSNRWADERISEIGAHLSSIVNPARSVSNVSEVGSYKWDNNQFRLVWWKNVALETWEESPVVGLGFGADLAAAFLQAYYPAESEDFNTRSPHNIALTAFGRMGLLGLAAWLALCLVIVREAWGAFRHDPDPPTWGLWSMVLVVLVSAHLGVVLEGPMGAVPFWVLLGLASAGQPAAEAKAALPPDREPDSA
jgi:O-antigen ligase